MASALDVRCPHCGAAPGNFCKTPSGTVRHAHASRKDVMPTPTAKEPAVIACPHCYAEQEAFEVSTVHTLTGGRYVAECEECEKRFEVTVAVTDPAA